MPTKAGEIDGAALAFIVEMCELRAGSAGLHAVIENVSSRPGQAHQFSFGRGFGMVLGVLETLGVGYSLTSPAQWKPAMGLRRLPDESQQQNKSRARQLASKLLPEHADKFVRVKDDGRAESYLLGRFFIFKNSRP